MRRADTTNLERLKLAFPEVGDELQKRYNAPSGLLPSEPRLGRLRRGPTMSRAPVNDNAPATQNVGARTRGKRFTRAMGASLKSAYGVTLSGV